MSTFSVSASTLGFVKNNTGSSWTSGKAYQGQYGGNSGSRVGAIIFSNLRNVIWAEQTISQIQLTLTYAGAGEGKQKNVSFYTGTRNSLSGGTGNSMRGSAIGVVSSNGSAYNSTRTITFSETSNSSAFANLVDFLQNGTTNTLVLYNGETTSSSTGWTSNYLCVTAATMVITYELSGSNGTLSSNTVPVGNSITLTISPAPSSGTVTHAVQWKMGTNVSEKTSYAENILSISYTIPVGWAASMTHLEEDAECLLTTYIDGSERATKSIAFKVTVSSTYNPTFSYSIAPSDSKTDYYQYLCGATITISNAAGQQGATITGYEITGTENISISGNITNGGAVATLDVFEQYGSHTYQISIADSRGAITTHTVTITVNALNAPTITTFDLHRYSWRYNDQMQIMYYESISGGNVFANISAGFDGANGNNSAEAYIRYREVGGTTYTRADLVFTGTSIAVADNAHLTIDGVDKIIIVDSNDNPLAISTNSNIEFELHIVDEHYDVFAYFRVERSWAPLHIAGTGYGVGIGRYSDGTSTTPKAQIAWPLYAEGGIYGDVTGNVSGQIIGSNGLRVDSVYTYTTTVNDFVDENSLATSFAPSDVNAFPIVRRNGSVVFFNGIVSPTRELSMPNNTTYYSILTLPVGYRPIETVRGLMQGSTTAVWLVVIESNGVVRAGRYRQGTVLTAIDSSTWMPITLSWITADVSVAIDA